MSTISLCRTSWELLVIVTPLICFFHGKKKKTSVRDVSLVTNVSSVRELDHSLNIYRIRFLGWWKSSSHDFVQVVQSFHAVSSNWFVLTNSYILFHTIYFLCEQMIGNCEFRIYLLAETRSHSETMTFLDYLCFFSFLHICFGYLYAAYICFLALNSSKPKFELLRTCCRY